MPTYMARARLAADAVNRAARSLIQAVVAEVVLVVGQELLRLAQDDATRWDIDTGVSIARVALFAAVAYVHRRYVDASPIPSLLPPADPNPNPGGII